MRNTSIMSVLAAGAFAFSGLAFNPIALATTSSDPDEVRNIKVTRIFTPKSLDSNDSSVVILDGYLPDGCYRLTQPEVHVNDEHKTISIQARANYFNVPCIEALVPYTQEVELGMLPGGNYRIQNGDGHQIGSLSIKKAQSKYPDDFLYAPVEDLILDQKETATDQHIATLRGRFTNSCMYIEHVDTKYFP
ncbi:MAG: hypothetical protein EBU49_12490, partial [Proteobacteria bacterium]|nr:hypothetical protein [Pseudomonadota bacterium]